MTDIELTNAYITAKAVKPGEVCLVTCEISDESFDLGFGWDIAIDYFQALSSVLPDETACALLPSQMTAKFMDKETALAYIDKFKAVIMEQQEAESE